MSKVNTGNYFEDFTIGQKLAHATPRTVNAGDVALYQALYGSRFALNSSAGFATQLGYKAHPIDDLLTFHLVFGKSVPDISLNAVANLGYANGRFLAPVYPGDTLSAASEVIGLKENSNGKTGVVYVRTIGVKNGETPVLDYIRWVMVNKRDAAAAAPTPQAPSLPEAVDANDLVVPAVNLNTYNHTAAGSPHRFSDYDIGETVTPPEGTTVEDAEHMMATRLYQNTAKVHFNQFTQKDSRFGRRLVYGGHVISIARALSFNGLENAQWIAAINGGRHVAPCFAGDTVFASTKVVDKAEVSDDFGALRLNLMAVKDRILDGHPAADDENVLLDFDYWALVPR
ncbi:MAG: MaoC family dehydratase [Alphaproteobacteria bacterium]